MNRLVACGLAALVLCSSLVGPFQPSASARTQSFDPNAPQAIVSVDYYGVRKVDQAALDQALQLKAGDLTDFDKPAIEARLKAVPGVRDAVLISVLMPGNAVVLVGIQEAGAPELKLRPAPTGDVRLTDEMIAAYIEISEQLYAGIMSGEGGEDIVDGHSFGKYAPLAAAERRLMQLARAEPQLVVQVLAESSAAEHRTAAAKALSYLADKRVIVRELSKAMLDADATVRNNATRALSILVKWVVDLPDPNPAIARTPDQDAAKPSKAVLVQLLQDELDPTPLLTMLESLTWTDRNKASALLASLVQLPNEALQKSLRTESLPALAEMAKWHSRGHALFATRILSSLAGREPIALMADDKAAREVGRLVPWVDALTEEARSKAESED